MSHLSEHPAEPRRVRVLRRSADLPEPELEPLLASLVRKEVLSLQSDPRSPERGQYGFLQDLLKTVAYETLSNKERKAKHLRTTDFIVSTWSGEEGEIVEVLASHFMAAYRADPNGSDASQIKTRARDMLARAGERAASPAAARATSSKARSR